MPVLEQVLETYPNDVKIIFKAFPLRIHEFSMKAATAALAAGAQGKFWEFHDLLFENHNGLNDKKITDIAIELKLNMQQFHEEMKGPLIASRIERDITEGKEAGIGGTPAIFINGRALRKDPKISFGAAIDAMIGRELAS